MASRGRPAWTRSVAARELGNIRRKQSPGGGITLRQVTRVNAAVLAALAAVSIAVVTATVSSGATSPLGKVNHIVVIYEENHSFDNLYGGWEGVNGLSKADTPHMTQVDQAGGPFSCLRPNDLNLAAMPTPRARPPHRTHS